VALSPNPSVPVAPLTGLARRLVSDALLTEALMRETQAEAVHANRPLVTQLVESKLISPVALAMAAAKEFGVPLADINTFEIDIAPYKKITERLIRTQHALPLFRRGRRLYIAVSDPTNLQALDEFKFATDLSTDAVLVEEDKLGRAIEAVVTQLQSDSLGMDDADLDKLEVASAEDADKAAEPERTDAEDAPIVRYVNKILLDAINRGASDVHFEPYEKKYRIRYRIDGVLIGIASPPVPMGIRIAARVKVMARLDLAERRVPQDGRIKLKLSRNKGIDFRVSTCPTLWGEKIVTRILDASSAMLGIEALGYEPEQKAKYLHALAKPQGMILFTGPTGSGKTVSMYTGLNILNTDGVNISTAEDPAEINLAGVNQVNINPKVGLTFAAALKSFLRQDPDIIMVGEVRDLETAEVAIKAAQTGHLVLSTLHTNDAPQTLTRLLNMGVPAYNIASSVTLIIAQRLARKLCLFCRKPTDIPREELLREGFRKEELGELALYKAVGCNQCFNGYKGRTGIYQVMEISDAIGRIIMQGGNAIQITDQAAKEDVADLRESALRKVRAGLLDLTEANRITVD